MPTDNNTKVFRTSPGSGGGEYGPRIFIDANVSYHLTYPEVGELDKLSTWKGNTASSSEYNMWEFPLDGVNYAKAYRFLRSCGWKPSV